MLRRIAEAIEIHIEQKAASADLGVMFSLPQLWPLLLLLLLHHSLADSSSALWAVLSLLSAPHLRERPEHGDTNSKGAPVRAVSHTDVFYLLRVVKNVAL